MDYNRTVKSLLEAYLFVAAEPVFVADVAKSLAAEPDQIEQAFEELTSEYGIRHGGLQIARLAGGYQMTTRPDLSEDIARLLDAPGNRHRLSKPALETLAIIAYQQPVTQAEIEAVRGVNVNGVLKTLLERKMIFEKERKAVPGRPILYATTPDFLHYFGLAELTDLPALDAPEPEEDREARHRIQEAVGLEEAKLEDVEADEC